MIRVVHPGSGCWISTHPGSRIQGSKRHRIPDPRSASATLLTTVLCQISSATPLNLIHRPVLWVHSLTYFWRFHHERKNAADLTSISDSFRAGLYRFRTELKDEYEFIALQGYYPPPPTHKHFRHCKISTSTGDLWRVSYSVLRVF